MPETSAMNERFHPGELMQRESATCVQFEFRSELDSRVDPQAIRALDTRAPAQLGH
jgi:hypothetical protein